MADRVGGERCVDSVVAAAPRAFAAGEDRGRLAEQGDPRVRYEAELAFLTGVQQCGAAEIEGSGSEARVDRAAGGGIAGRASRPGR
ncbi:hypothetical protein NHF48_015395 [Sphingomonas sp. H160509]|uniref:hypothetical protein n=1 Tax=Sphingomonas sp. H160509 TaxID=2955313 RepID=UPI0020983770|nr:hypothetical protein [Sphingomonas sp. H160509]MDD1452011.1 hypothetical protein [Sphingomonas sp. H160509]